MAHLASPLALRRPDDTARGVLASTNGPVPLFFGAAQKALDALAVVGEGVHTVIIDLEDVPAIDATGLVALESTVAMLNRSGVKVVLSGVKPQPRRALEKAGFVDAEGSLEVTDNTDTTPRPDPRPAPIADDSLARGANG